MIKLTIISDPICPWCHIGATNLLRALEARPGHPFLLSWKPFFLNPDMPTKGMDRGAYLEGKFGGKKRAAAAYAPIAEAAEAAGLRIDFAAIQRTPNTTDAHRLLHWAEIEGAQTRVAMALFRAYFHDGEDISDHGTLVRIAGECGMDRQVASKLLPGTADRDLIRNAAAESARIGVTGIPTFMVGTNHAVAGAQPSELWVRVIDELAGNLPETNGADQTR